MSQMHNTGKILFKRLLMLVYVYPIFSVLTNYTIIIVLLYDFLLKLESSKF